MKYLQAAGFSVETDFTQDLDALDTRLKVPEKARACHIATAGPYIVEGHVPASVIQHLLRTRPKRVAGIAVPGMPSGSPGMESPQPEPYDVIAWRPSGETFVYARVGANGQVRY